MGAQRRPPVRPWRVRKTRLVHPPLGEGKLMPAPKGAEDETNAEPL
jgi:hypothetical protein